MTEGNWRSSSTNLGRLPWRVAHAALGGHGQVRAGASIVNIASILVLRVGQALSHYAVAKAGVVAN